MSVLMAELTRSQHSLARSKDALPRTVAAGVWDAQHCQGAVVPDLRNALDFSFENWRFDFFFRDNMLFLRVLSKAIFILKSQYSSSMPH